METLDRMPVAAQDAVWARLAEIADKSFLDSKQREMYDESCKIMWDTYSAKQSAKKEGRYEVAHNLKAMGMTPDFIMKATDLTAEEVGRLR